MHLNEEKPPLAATRESLRAATRPNAAKKKKFCVAVSLNSLTASVTSKNKIKQDLSLKNHFRGFAGGAVVESLPANAGDTGSSPGLGRSHMLLPHLGATRPMSHNY